MEDEISFYDRFVANMNKYTLIYNDDYMNEELQTIPCELLDISDEDVEMAIPIPITVNIKHLKKGMKITLQLNITDYVLAIKKEIYSRFQIPVAAQRLLFKGKVLADDKIIKSYSQESNLNLTLIEKEEELKFPLQDFEFGRSLLKLLKEQFTDSQVLTILQDFDRKYRSWLDSN